MYINPYRFGSKFLITISYLLTMYADHCRAVSDKLFSHLYQIVENNVNRIEGKFKRISW